MPRTIQRARTGCALHGALKAVKAVKGFIPIVHSNAGCSVQEYLGGNLAGAGVGSGHLSGLEIASSNVSEKQIIFGGTSRLREEIKNTVKVLAGDLYIVLSGCSTEIVGDDIPAMTKEAKEQGFPVIHVSTPGFRGDVREGYKLLFKGIVDQLGEIGGEQGEKVTGLVNILGVIPEQDVFWEGNLDRVKRLFESVGVKANTLFGFGQSIENWKLIGSAQLNIALSPWGIDVAKYLEEKYGTPFLEVGNIPSGFEDSRDLLVQTGEKLGLDPGPIRNIIQSEEDRLSYDLRRAADLYLRHDFQKEFVIVGESHQVKALLKLLCGHLGLVAKAAVITDLAPDTEHAGFEQNLKELAGDNAIEILFTGDGEEINRFIRKNKPQLVVGSSFEKNVAAELKIPLLQTAFPLKGKLVLNRSYAGFRGAVELLEDLGDALLGHEK